MHSLIHVALLSLILVSLSTVIRAQYEDDDDISYEKRAAPMRNALIRFGRAAPSGGPMRNALVRFGKRSATTLQDKRNAQPQPFVRFGRSGGHVDHMHDILSTIQRLQYANN